MSETAAETPATQTDFTVDPSQLKPGTVIFEYGYIPCIYFDTEDDGKLEVARFGGLHYEDARNFSTQRGPKPASLLPTAPPTADRIATLEQQIQTLTTLLQEKVGVETPAPAPAEPATPAPPPVSPFSVDAPSA